LPKKLAKWRPSFPASFTAPALALMRVAAGLADSGFIDPNTTGSFPIATSGAAGFLRGFPAKLLCCVRFRSLHLLRSLFGLLVEGQDLIWKMDVN